eukprot:872013_1
MWCVILLTIVKRAFENMSCRIDFTIKTITVLDQHLILQIWNTASQVVDPQRDQILADEYGMEFLKTRAKDKVSVTESFKWVARQVLTRYRRILLIANPTNICYIFSMFGIVHCCVMFD